MASCIWSSSSAGSPSVTLTVTETATSTENNTSTVSYSLVISRPYNISSSASKSYSITINGSTVKSGSTTIGGSGSKTIASGTTTIAHNADGTKSISFSFSLTLAITWNGSYISTASSSGSVALSTIARATQPSLSSSTTAMGSSVTINTPRASSNFKHILYYEFQGSGWQWIASDVGTSYTWTIPLSLASRIPSSTSAWGNIHCETYNNGTLIGTKTVPFQATVPSSVVPSISSVSISEATTGIAAKFGAYVQGKSTLAVSISAAGSYSSTIKSYKTVIQGASYSASSFVSSPITASGAISITTTVTDSRGRTASTEKSVTALAYSPPTFSSLAVDRIDTSGEDDDNGERIAVSMKYAISPVNNLNERALVMKYKSYSDTGYTTFSSGTAEWSYDGTVNFTDSPVISADSSYTIRLELSDYFQTAVLEYPLPTAYAIADFLASGQGMSLGKVAEKDGLEVAWPVYHNKAVTVDNTITANVYKGGQSGTWTPQFGNSVGGSDASGQWYKIGKLVYVHGHIALNTASTVASRALIAGFPFKSAQKAFLGLTNNTFVPNSNWPGFVGLEIVENSKQASFVLLALGRVWESTNYSELGTGFIDFSGIYLTDK